MNTLVDGPLDVFLACDKSSITIKGIDTPINGEADVLIFPSLEAANSFYKGLMLFAGGELVILVWLYLQNKLFLILLKLVSLFCCVYKNSKNG